MLTQNQINEIREELDNCARPIFLYDDDQDGLCSFLLLYRYKREGKGMIIKTTPKRSPPPVCSFNEGGVLEAGC